MQNNKGIKIQPKNPSKGVEGNTGMKKTSGGARKFGRSKKKCQRYQDDSRREENKIRKWKKLIKKLSPDNRMRKQLEKRIKEVEI